LLTTLRSTRTLALYVCSVTAWQEESEVAPKPCPLRSAVKRFFALAKRVATQGRQCVPVALCSVSRSVARRWVGGAAKLLTAEERRGSHRVTNLSEPTVALAQQQKATPAAAVGCTLRAAPPVYTLLPPCAWRSSGAAAAVLAAGGGLLVLVLPQQKESELQARRRQPLSASRSASWFAGLGSVWRARN